MRLSRTQQHLTLSSTQTHMVYFISPGKSDPPPALPQDPHNCNRNNDDNQVPGCAGASVENATLQDPTTPHPLVHPDPYGFPESGFGTNSISETQDGFFTFSSSEYLRSQGSQCRPKNPRKKGVNLIGRRSSKNGVRVGNAELRSDTEVRSEDRKGGSGRRLPFCLKKRRKTTKHITAAAKTGFCSSEDSSLFGWGVSFGIMYMMSAGQAEISKLNKTMDETAKVIQELKSEINRRKSSSAHQILDSVGNTETNSCKPSGWHDEAMLKKTNSELRDTDVKIWSLPVNDDGECGSSALTEEPLPQVLEMDQLEAELEFELQKLSGCTIDSASHAEIRPKLDELEVPEEGCHGTDDWNFNSSQSHGVLASELNQKLSHLLIKQQENQISELESELDLAQSNLNEKEAELQALKDCVRHLTELSLSRVSDDETETRTDPRGTSNWDSNNMDSESKQSVVGVKRPITY